MPTKDPEPAKKTQRAGQKGRPGTEQKTADPKGAGKSVNYQREGSAGAARFRATNTMPEGTQAQHWTKVLSAKKTGMSPQVMNTNMSPLQSRKDKPATTMLTDPKGGGTKYRVTGDKGSAEYSNEHKFADRFMVKRAEERITAKNPKIDPQKRAIAAGAQARWEMTGHPGNVPPNVARVVNIAKGEKLGKLDQGGEKPAGKANRSGKAASSGADRAQPSQTRSQGGAEFRGFPARQSQSRSTAAEASSAGKSTPPRVSAVQSAKSASAAKSATAPTHDRPASRTTAKPSAKGHPATSTAESDARIDSKIEKLRGLAPSSAKSAKAVPSKASSQSAAKATAKGMAGAKGVGAGAAKPAGTGASAPRIGAPSPTSGGTPGR